MIYRCILTVCTFFIAISISVADDVSIAAQVADMTLEQKVAQMFMVSFFGEELTQIERQFLRDIQPGAVVMFGKNIESPEQVTRLTNDYQQTIIDGGGIPLLIAVDQEGGRIQHLQEGFTRFPLPMLWTATQNTDLAYQVGEAMATEMRAVGVNMNLAPIADLNTNVDNPIIGTRSFGSEVELVNPILTHFIHGLQDNGVVATAKHFPGHGDTESDSHIELPVINHSLDRLRAVELLPFQSAVDANVGVTMVSHIWFTELDTEPIPASLSPRVINQLLRDEMSYDGVIMTDALDMDAIDTMYTAGGSAIQAILAGNDLIAIGAHVGTATIETAINDVVEAVNDGRLDEAQIDRSVSRILQLKRDYGIFEWQPLDPFTVSERLNLELHDTLVTQLFEQGVTVVGGDDLLPAQGQVAVIYLATRPRIIEECSGFDGDVVYVGVSATPTDDESAWALSASVNADTVIVFTQNTIDNPQQRALVNALPPEKTVVAALWNTSDMLMFPDVAGYILGYSPMLRATAVMCDIVVGRQSAMGTLPITYINN